MNPLIDIGQIEGGFVMGLGCHLMEDIIYDVSTGRVLNDGTWVRALFIANGESEGAFVMALDYQLMEDIYDTNTGARVQMNPRSIVKDPLDDGTWVRLHSSSSTE